MALRTHRVPPPTSVMTFVIVRGDEVMLAARPEAGLGVIVEVLVGAGEAVEVYLHDQPAIRTA